MGIEWIKDNIVCADKRNHEYTIITLARDVQTGEGIVVYKQNFGEMETLCCPLDAFNVSFRPADEKETKVSIIGKRPVNGAERMELFFETDNFDEKMRILKELRVLGELTDSIIDNIAAALDVVIEKGDLNSRYDQLRICVETRARYETGRLRIGDRR